MASIPQPSTAQDTTTIGRRMRLYHGLLAVVRARFVGPLKPPELIPGLSALRYGPSSLAVNSDAGRRIRHDKSAQMDRSNCNGNFRNGDFQYCDARHTAPDFYWNVACESCERRTRRWRQAPPS